LFHHAFLSEHPPGISLKELRNLIAKWEKNDTESTLRNWLDGQAKLRETLISDLIPELFAKTIEFRNDILGKAADAKLEIERKNFVKLGHSTLKLLKILSF